MNPYGDPYAADGKPAAPDARLRRKKSVGPSSSSSSRERRASRDIAPGPVRVDDPYEAGRASGYDPGDRGAAPLAGTRRLNRDPQEDAAGYGGASQPQGGLGMMADPKEGMGDTRRASKKAVPGLSTGGTLRALGGDGPVRPMSARRTIDLAPQRSQQEPLSMPQPGPLPDAEAAGKADREREVEKERRLAEKREKRRLMMEREALEMQRAKPAEPVVAVPLAPPAPAPAPEPVRAPAPAPAPSKQKAAHKSKHAKAEEDEGGYDDDFETYSGDEFEEEEEAAPKKREEVKQAAAPKPAVSKPAPSAKASRDAPAASAKKGAFTVVWGSGITGEGGRRERPSSSLGLKLSSSLNPRSVRAKRVLQLLTLDTERFVALEQQPIPKFDLYQRRLWASRAPGVVGGIRQAASQTNDDSRTVESQTAEVERHDKAMQFYLGDDTDFLDALTRAAAAPSRRGPAGAPARDAASLDEGSSMRLLGFLQRAAPVCETLLEENLGEGRRGGEAKEERDSLAVAGGGGEGAIFAKQSEWVLVGAAEAGGKAEAKGAAAEGWQMLLGGRPVKGVLMSLYQPHVLLTVHGAARGAAAAGGGEAKEEAKGGKAREKERERELKGRAVAARDVLAVWDAALLLVGRNVGPSKLLTAEGPLSSWCLGPGLVASVLVAGTESGALHLWDLREAREAHMPEFCVRHRIGAGLRPPTYSTYGLSGQGHVSSVVSVVPIVSGADDAAQQSTGFQLASLDDRSTLTLWLVSEVAREEGRAGGAAEDIGLALGGRLRLVRTRSLQLWGGEGPQKGLRAPRPGLLGEVDWDVSICEAAALEAGPVASCMAFVPSDLSHLLVGTVSGAVLRRSRFAETKPPLEYVRDARLPIRLPSAACAVDFSPFLPDFFLAGYDDGRFNLFSLCDPEPRLEWDVAAMRGAAKLDRGADRAVTAVRFSPHRPAVFYVLLGHAKLLLTFDLLVNEREPIFTEDLGKGAGTGDTEAEEPTVMSMSAERPSHLAAGRKPSLVVSVPGARPGEGGGAGARLRHLRKGLYTAVPDEQARVQELLS